MLFTARIALDEHPWLAGHTVLGHILFPGTAFLELAQTAAHRVSLTTVEELSLLAPLVLPTKGAVLVQLSVGTQDATGRRPLALHARVQNAPDGTPWTQYAAGRLAPARDDAGFDLRSFPPAFATPVSLDGLYDRLAMIGLDYGPDFQNLRAVWQRGNDLFAEVTLPTSITPDAGRYSLHPALLDAAVHPLALALLERGRTLALPFAWAGVSFHGPGVASARVHLAVSDDETSCAVRVADSTGEPILAIDALRSRLVTGSQFRLGLAPVADALYMLDWSAKALDSAPPLRGPIVWLGTPSGAIASALAMLHDAHDAFGLDNLDALRAHLDRGGSSPVLVLLPCARGAPAPEGLPRAALDATSGLLAALQSWLTESPRFASSRLVVLTRRAVATSAEEDVLDLTHASLWGLLRSTQNEFQERAISILDIDDDVDSHVALPRALARAAREPQMALRCGDLRVPRLVRAPVHVQPNETPPFDESGTVLITGGTGGLGSTVARHLVETHGVRHLVLLSRRGPAAPDADSLCADLRAAGASVTIKACDVGDRDALLACINAIPSGHPLTAVIHTAGGIDDALLLDQSRERLGRVFRPKADAAFHLDELTRDQPVRTFALFSSAACMLGGQAQANYAAANAVLDALAQHRRAQGLPAVSLSWGPWAHTGLAARLDSTDRARFERIGCPPLHPTEALALFDVALCSSVPTLAPLRLDLARLREHAAHAPPLFQRLLRAPSLSTVDPSRGLRSRLQRLSSAERHVALLDIVREMAALRLGFASPHEIAADARFMELGLNSLTALELRQQLGHRLGLSLPATLFFDSPTPHDAASVLLALLDPELPPEGADPEPNDMHDQKRPTSLTVARGHGGGDALARILRQAHELGVLDDGLRIIESAAEIRAQASAMAEARPDGHGRSTQPPVRLAGGHAMPKLLCFPALAVPTGPVQYARFASELQGLRDVWVLPNPGFSAGEPLPRSIDEIVAHQTEAVLRCESDAPIALLGMSSGGWIAHAVAERLERLGHAPSAVVLLDTYLKDAIHPRFASALQKAWMDRFPEILRLDDELTAMTWYQRLFGTWRPTAIATPTLLVRASELLSEADGDDFDWRTRWDLPHVSVEVPGDHMNMLFLHSEITASAVHEWLTQQRAQHAAE
jgi:thioesterase domain-containing protein/NAD(P)-dependent dehydrogenase (short-subunit alcohol dehydrogenase family)